MLSISQTGGSLMIESCFGFDELFGSGEAFATGENNGWHCLTV